MEIMPNLHLVPGVRGVNAYLLLGDAPTLVDTGMPGSDRAILNYMDRLGLELGELARVVITHHHVDHIGALAAIKQRTSALVIAHPSAIPFISGEQPLAPPRGAVMRLLFRFVPVMSRFDPVPVDLTVDDGDHLDVLGGAVVLHVPGHTPGSIALHFPSERLLICGDAVNGRAGRVAGPAKPFTVDMAQALASVRRMAELEFDVLCPGHGAPLVGGADAELQALAQELT
jgi:glyoxylase-like metal-dependent hydrolase (beta-lactamase superfamily II)